MIRKNGFFLALIILALVLAILNAMQRRGSGEAADAATLEVGRYRFVAVGSGVGYRFDTATGELYHVFQGSERLISDGIADGAAIGRFDVIPRRRVSELGIELDPASWFLVDTATGHVWRIGATEITYMGDPARLQ